MTIEVRWIELPTPAGQIQRAETIVCGGQVGSVRQIVRHEVPPDTEPRRAFAHGQLFTYFVPQEDVIEFRLDTGGRLFRGELEIVTLRVDAL